MSAKSLSGKQSKKKKTSASTPKKAVTTVAALFKKQLLQQKGKHTSNIDQDSETEEIVFVKEETKSVYFSSQNFQSRSQQKDSSKKVSSECLGEKNLTLGKDSSSAKLSAKSNVLESEKKLKLSRRLSLKKANQERKSTDDAKNQDNANFVTVDNQGDGKVKISSHKSSSVPSCSESVGVTSVTGLKGDSHHKGATLQDPRCATILQNTNIPDVDEDISLSDAVTSDTAQSSSSVKSKLSLKRKRTSPDSLPTSVNPKTPRPESNSDIRDNSFVGTTVKKCRKDSSSTTPVFSIFKQSSGKGKSPEISADSKTSVNLADKDHKTAVGDSTESPASSTSVTRNIRKSQGQKRKFTRLKDGDEAKSAARSETDLPTSSELDVEETGGKARENIDDDDEDVKEETLYRVPYYLENFSTITKSVFADDYYVQLFSEEDMNHVEDFNNLSETSQKLYVRLFSRKLAWLSIAKIKYPEIADDMTPCFEELVRANLLSSGEQLDDLPAMLGAMSAPNLRTLAKSYHVNHMGQQKGQIIQTLVTKSQQSTVASLFGQKIGGVKMAMMKRAKNLLGPVYRLCLAPRAVFVRAMMLFSLINTNGDDESGSGGQGQLFQMLLVNMGRVVYPAYTVNRRMRVFRCRQDLIRFEEALQLEAELLGHISSGNWKSAYTSFLTVKETYDNLAKEDDIVKWDSELPEFLRYYTAGSVLVRLLNQGIEILQRRKEYLAAVILIRELLGQNVYNLDVHGYWWDRLALNLDVHLKQPAQALQAIQDGLADPLVRTGHRLSLYLRAEMICSKPKSPFRQRLKSFVHEPLADLPKTIVEGRVLPHTLPGSRYQFITNTSSCVEGDDEVTMCNVEQIVLDHYRLNGFPQGIHAEGSVVSNLFCLYFWDTLFMDVADAFHSPYQTSPLDLHTDAFYEQRQKTINDRLDAIENSDEETLHAMLAATWEKQNGVMCAGINWERFSSVAEVQGLVSCMGGKVLSGILRRYAQQPRHTRSGFPDLTLWNTSTKQLKISEVKGPGDRLSHKQMLWLDYLLKMGVDAEVSHVKPIGVKKLKPISKLEQDKG